MNKFFLITLLTLITFSIDAQTRKCNSVNAEINSARHSRSVADTLMPFSFIDSANGGSGCTLATYSVDLSNPVDSGYISGTNIYGDLEKGQRYVFSDYGFDTVTVEKLIVHFSIIHQSGSLGLLSGKIYSVDAQGLPDSLLATSNPVSVSSISVIINGIAEFDFPSSVTVSGGLVAVIDFSNCLTDTLAIVQTEANCFDQTGGSCEKWNDSTWHHFNNTWAFETDLSIFAVLSNAIASSTSSALEQAGKNIFPNPCSSYINIELGKNENDIRLLNITGEEIFHAEDFNASTLQISTANFPAGIYSALIASNGNLRAVNFVVQH
ncbi:MAG: T9SS type A sorting domain-containing protein [Bacteroidota bacterium]